MKVRATNPGPPPTENPGDCASCGFGVPKPPKGGGTSAARRAWAMSQVGRPVVNPGPGGDAPLEPEGYGMARQFKPRKGWEDAPPGTHPGRFGNPRQQAATFPQQPMTQRRWHSRLARNCDAGVGLALAATQAPTGPIRQANPPPLHQGRGGQLDYADQYAVFGPGVRPYGGYGGVGYAPGGTSIPTAYPVAPPGVYMQGQSCYSATDCAPGEYCHGGMCFPTPGVQNVGGQRTVSVGGRPVNNPATAHVLTFPTKKRMALFRRARGNPPVGDLTHGMPPGAMSHKNAHEIQQYAAWLAQNVGPQSSLPGWAEHKLSQARTHIGDVKHYVAHEEAHRAENPGAPMTQMTQSLAPPGFSVR